jgi:hypothetical protein
VKLFDRLRLVKNHSLQNLMKFQMSSISRKSSSEPREAVRLSSVSQKSFSSETREIPTVFN